jgi:transposase-like protein
MVHVPVQCPHCQSTEVIKAGKQANGPQRYRCQNGQCERRIFLLQYQDRGRAPEIRPARWSTWLSMAAASAIPPARCGSVPRP